MRKASSTGNLRRMGVETKSMDHTAVSGRQTSLRRSGSNSAAAALKPGRKASSDQDLCRLGAQPAFRSGSLPSGTARRSAMTASALPYYDAIPPAELAEDVLEASFARGLASAECFELYGPIRAAPQLTGGGDPNDDSTHWSAQAASSQQLAACLATPFTGQDQNLGEIVRGEVDRLTADQELKTQLRYAEELRMRRSTETEEEEEEEEQSAEQALGRQRRVRLRRRPSEEILDAQLADIGVAGGKPIAGAGGAKRDPALAPSPETVVLQTMFSSLDDDSNRLTLDEEALAQPIDAHDGVDKLPMDASRTRAPSKAKLGSRSAFINITARAAPSLAGA